jgi:hypothetical protein
MLWIPRDVVAYKISHDDSSDLFVAVACDRTSIRQRPRQEIVLKASRDLSEWHTHSILISDEYVNPSSMRWGDWIIAKDDLFVVLGILDPDGDPSRAPTISGKALVFLRVPSFRERSGLGTPFLDLTK